MTTLPLTISLTASSGGCSSGCFSGAASSIVAPVFGSALCTDSQPPREIAAAMKTRDNSRMDHHLPFRFADSHDVEGHGDVFVAIFAMRIGLENQQMLVVVVADRR